VGNFNLESLANGDRIIGAYFPTIIIRFKVMAKPDGSSSSEFNSEDFLKVTIASPLMGKLEDIGESQARGPEETLPVVIDLNSDYIGEPFGLPGAKLQVQDLIRQLGCEQAINVSKSQYARQYLFATLAPSQIKALVALDMRSPQNSRAIKRIWPDFQLKAQLHKSIATIKANAAHQSFAALGDNIVWAVMDSGIDATHPHFTQHQNLILKPPLLPKDFTTGDLNPLQDDFGHGTHVAGIIAGELTEPASDLPKSKKKPATEVPKIHAYTRTQDQEGEIAYDAVPLQQITGVAPRAKLLSLKVLDENGDGLVSSAIAAIGYIQELNEYGRQLRVHGVNMSLGYEFDAEWFGCGNSPLCVEVNRLVRSGVVVVVAAGNTGFGVSMSAAKGGVRTGLDLTINDPGNAELAITVGATHREAPHQYGTSYFSSKGPTGDGRLKPDLIAPGEKILSCAAGSKRAKILKKVSECNYLEESGTSMASPHVSGAIAAFLSVRREFIGQPETVKQIFLDSATDLKRDRYFQGYGLLDLMRAIQSI
jgi:serine protease AprX